MKKMIFIEDHVMPQLFTSAREAYEFEHKSSERGKAYKNLETFGLLWGYSIPAKGDTPPKVIATMCTVETSATRHTDWVAPNFDSLQAKKDFFQSYWPNIELVGTFHSHPYEDLDEVMECKGWRASDSSDGEANDQVFFPHFHEEIAPEQDTLAHLIVAVTELEKRGWAYPDRLSGGERTKGYVLSADNYKFWIRGYSTDFVLDPDDEDDEGAFVFSDDSDLEIPSLENRFK